MKMSQLSCMCSLILLCAPPVLADKQQQTTPSSHAPISVMGDHLHRKGEWMTSYRYMQMDMEGIRIGSKRLSAREVVGTGQSPGQFMVAPTLMPMDMHMFGAMYGLSDQITIMAMTSFVANKMDHLVRNGRTFTTRSSGMGDSKIAALISLYRNETHSFHLNLGVSIPTGSTNERDDTPAVANAFLPYPMQLGSGTYDILPALTYKRNGNHFSWGIQASSTIRTDRNDEGYRLGDRVSLSTWVARNFSQNLSMSLGLKYQDWKNIVGENAALNPGMIQTANTQLQAGERNELSIGANYLFDNGHRIAIEYAKPVSQDLAGPQLETNSLLTIGWQKAF